MARSIPTPEADAAGLTILGALAQLKQEIQQLQDEAIGRRELPMFLIEGGELELKLVARRERKADGKLGAKFRLFVADADAALAASQANTQETVQTLKLRFGALRRPDGSASAPPPGETARGLQLQPGPTQAGLPTVEAGQTPSGIARDPSSGGGSSNFGW